MGKHGQLVMGPAGCGKSTYCKYVYEHCKASRRRCHVVNLDPAAENFNYPVAIDIRELVTADDVAEEMHLGPNGALLFCMEYLMENFAWLEEKLGDFSDDYLLFDCPGQIELYSHVPVIPRLARMLQQWGYNICGVYLLDALFVTKADKFISGILSCLSCMISVELPHVNVLSKCDMLKSADQETMELILDPNMDRLVATLKKEDGPFKGLNNALADLIESYNMVSFMPMNIRDTGTIQAVLQHIDHAIQYGEDLETQGEKLTEHTMELKAGSLLNANGADFD